MSEDKLNAEAVIATEVEEVFSDGKTANIAGGELASDSEQIGDSVR